MNYRLKWFRRTLAGAREHRKVRQILLGKGVVVGGKYRAALLLPNWHIAKWNGHHWRVFDDATTLATLHWRYGGKHSDFSALKETK